MACKRFRPEDVIAKLREADVLLGQGKRVAEVVKALGVSEVTYYRWRQEYGGMSAPQARRLKELERENARLRRAVADLTLDKQILKEAAEGMYGPPPARKLNAGRYAERLCQCIRPRRGARSAPGLGGYPPSGAPRY